MKQTLNNKKNAKEVSFSLPVSIMKQGRRFIAYTPALDIATSASTERKVRASFSELVIIFMEELHEKGTTAEVLSELGWRRVEKVWMPPAVASQSIGMKVPTFA